MSSLGRKILIAIVCLQVLGAYLASTSYAYPSPPPNPLLLKQIAEDETPEASDEPTWSLATRAAIAGGFLITSVGGFAVWWKWRARQDRLAREADDRYLERIRRQ